MSLKQFHILFISLGTLCFVVFGLWCFSSPFGPGVGSALPLAGGLSIVLGFVTAFYGMWFYRTKIRGAVEQEEPA